MTTFDFDRYAEEGKNFMNALSKDFGHPDDKKKTARKLKAILHAIRDRLTLEESLQLLAQLPMSLKAIYVVNWSSKKPKKRVKHAEEFFQEIIEIDAETSFCDFPDTNTVEKDTLTVFSKLRDYISLGEMEDIKAILPKELKYLTNKVLMI